MRERGWCRGERSHGVREDIAEIVLEKHGEQHGEETDEREDIGAVAPAEALPADEIVAALEEVGGAKKFPRPEPGGEAAVGRCFEIIGDGEDDEGERGAEDDAPLFRRAGAKPEWEDRGDDEPRGALEVVECFVDRGEAGAEFQELSRLERRLMLKASTAALNANEIRP